MSTLQSEFCRVLLSKRIDLKKENKIPNGVSISTIGRWQAGIASPTLETVEKVLQENDIDLPFFFDGKIESLIDFNKKVAEGKGLKIQIIFE